jgi:hypothetical protein
MQVDDCVHAVFDALNEHQVPFMLVGALSSNFYGIPRSTLDADLVIELGSKSLAGVLERLKDRVRLDPQMIFETVTMSRAFRADVIGMDFTIEFFLLGAEPYHQERFHRRRRVRYRDRDVCFPTREDVVVQKLRWARPKYLEDARDVIAVQGDDAFDWDYIHRWTETHGTRELLDEIRASIPEI